MDSRKEKLLRKPLNCRKLRKQYNEQTNYKQASKPGRKKSIEQMLRTLAVVEARSNQRMLENKKVRTQEMKLSISKNAFI